MQQGPAPRGDGRPKVRLTLPSVEYATWRNFARGRKQSIPAAVRAVMADAVAGHARTLLAECLRVLERLRASATEADALALDLLIRQLKKWEGA
jgi:hypothetical protein